jgi:hypothetical protein
LENPRHGDLLYGIKNGGRSNRLACYLGFVRTFAGAGARPLANNPYSPSGNDMPLAVFV